MSHVSRPLALCVAAALTFTPGTSATAREMLLGPIAAEVMEVVDGDTLKVRAHIWLGQAEGPDAPPLHNPRYDFNDGVLETGVRLHVALARHWLRD